MKTSGGGDLKDEGRRWKCKNYTLPPPSQTTTTTTKTTTDEPQSVVGATANAVGTVILFPFRVVGDTLELIF